MAEPPWTPVNDTERAMADALLRADTPAYFRALIQATLYLPGFSGTGPQRLVTVDLGEDTHLVVFTSPESMSASLRGVEGYRTIGYPELVERWPDPRWLLAVDPDLPIQGFMPIGVPTRGAAGGVELTAMDRDVAGSDRAADLGADGEGADGEGAGGELVPVNDTERAIVDALRDGDADGLLRALVLAEVWLPVAPDGQWRRWAGPAPVIAVVTAPQRLRAGTASTPMRLLDVALAWPGPDVGLLVDPGTPIELSFPGGHVPGFVGWADELVNGPRPPSVGSHRITSRAVPSGTHPRPGTLPVAGLPSESPWSGSPWSGSSESEPVPTRAPAPVEVAAAVPVAEAVPVPDAGAVAQRRPVMLQKLVPHDLVDWYLRGHGRQVSGPVCGYEEVRHLRTPAQLYAALGAGEPFRPEDREVHVIRWLAPCPDLHPAAGRRAEVPLLRSHAAVLPHGAQLYRLDTTGRATPVASYDADVEGWVPAPDAGALRAALLS